MQVILINGSPNKKGATSLALSEVERTLNEDGIETQNFWVGAKPISGCLGCGKCAKLGKCIIDDHVNEFRQLAYSADGFVFGSPVHYSAISGQLKSFMDRLFFSEFMGNKNKAFRLKPAAAVAVARRCGSATAFSQMNKYFGIQEMYIVSSRYWNDVFALTPDEVSFDAEGLCNMRVLAHNMAYFLRLVEAGKASNIPLPKVEEPVFTNFHNKIG